MKEEKEEKQKKKRLPYLVLILFLAAGIGVMCYPYIARYIGSFETKEQIEEYGGYVHDLTEDKKQEIKDKIADYNRHAATEDGETYLEAVSGLMENGTLGTIEIPEVDLKTPLFFGVSGRELSAGAGHVAGTSLPTDETRTVSMFAGHCGLSYLKIFDGLHEAKAGMEVRVTVLDDTYVYRIREMKTVEPNAVAAYEKPEGEKTTLVLVTCTPVGINSHRLLAICDYEKTETAQ